MSENSLPEIDYKKLSKKIGYKPNQWQKDVDQEDARFLTLCIGRRGGKTYWAAASPKHGLVRDFLLPNQHVWIVAPDYQLTQRVWNEVKKLKRLYFEPIIERFTDTKGNYLIETKLGTIIEAKSAQDPEALIGVGLTKLIVDEAARVPEKAWYQSLRSTLVDHKGKAIFISTPKGYNWFKDVYDMAETDDNYKSFHFSSFANEYVDKKELKEMAKEMPKYEYQQEVKAEFTSNLEEIFDIERIRKQDGLAKKRDTGLRTMGIDLGKGLSYTTIFVLEEDGSCSYFDRFQGDWSVQVEKIKEVIEKFDVPFARIDATGKGDPIVEQLLDSGAPVEPFIFSGVSKKQLLDKLSLAVQREKIGLPKEEKIIFDELRSFGREKTPSGNEIYKPLKKITDDCVMGLALAVWDMNIDIYEDADYTNNVIQSPVISYA